MSLPAQMFDHEIWVVQNVSWTNGVGRPLLTAHSSPVRNLSDPHGINRCMQCHTTTSCMRFRKKKTTPAWDFVYDPRMHVDPDQNDNKTIVLHDFGPTANLFSFETQT
ncbi:hypothetical protein VPH35_096207 [Triticum aestivum]